MATKKPDDGDVQEGVSEPSRTDHDLLRAWVGGDARAFQQLVERHQLRLCRLAHAIIGDDQAALEAVDEAFLRLAKHAEAVLATARQEGLGGWLCTVARNAAIDLLRRGARPVVLTPEDPPSPEAGAAERARAHDTGAVLWRAVADLPPLERAAVMLRYRDGLPYADIAAQLGKSIEHVGVILHQALGRLRRVAALRAEVLS